MESGENDVRIVERLRTTYKNKESRLYYITMDDLRNVRCLFNLQPGRLHEDDITSFTMRIDEKRAEDGVKLYIPAKNDTGEGFKLVILTATHLQWLRKYGNRGVVLDDTHNVTKYSLKLSTLLVLDEYDRGRPAGFLVSHSTTADDVADLFAAIKTETDEFQPKWLMTDEANCFWNGFIKVYPNGGKFTAKILCRWHICMAWKKKAKETIKDKSVYRQVMKRLCRLLKEPFRAPFERGLDELISILKANACDMFEDYLKRHYLGQTLPKEHEEEQVMPPLGTEHVDTIVRVLLKFACSLPTADQPQQYAPTTTTEMCKRSLALLRAALRRNGGHQGAVVSLDQLAFTTLQILYS